MVCCWCWERVVSSVSSLEDRTSSLLLSCPVCLAREDWVELKEVWMWDSSAVVCSLCSWRHTLRLLIESFRVLNVSLSDWRSLSIFCLSRSTLLFRATTLLSRATTKPLILVAIFSSMVSTGGRTSVVNYEL